MNVFAIFQTLRAIPFVRDIATLQIGRLVYTAATFLGSIAFARLLGLEQYGVYAVTLAFVSTFKAFIGLGQSTALQVFFAEEYGERDLRGMACVLRNYLQVILVLAALLVILALLSPILASFFYGTEAKVIGSYATALFLFSILDMGNSTVLILLQAIREIRMKTILEQGATIAFIALATTFLLLGRGIWGIITGQILASVFFLFISLIVWNHVRRRHSLPTFSDVLAVPLSETKPYLFQGFWFSIDKNIGNLYPSGLFFILSLVAPVTLVGLARIALQLASLSTSLLLPQVAELSTTVLASMKAQGKAVLRKNAYRILCHSTFLHLIVSGGALLVFPLLIPLLYGPSYREAIPLTIFLIALSLPAPLCLLNSPLLRLFRKIQYSIIVAATTITLMWSCIYFLASTLTPEKSFLIAYGLGQVLPLSLTVYVFGVILRK